VQRKASGLHLSDEQFDKAADDIAIAVAGLFAIARTHTPTYKHTLPL
jgi:hypothetical protein